MGHGGRRRSEHRSEPCVPLLLSGPWSRSRRGYRRLRIGRGPALPARRVSQNHERQCDDDDGQLRCGHVSKTT
jgi:hypothetical protein